MLCLTVRLAAQPMEQPPVMPAVEGKTLVESQRLIDQAGLRSPQILYAEGKPEGVVFRQVPEAGRPAGSTIYLSVGVVAGPSAVPEPVRKRSPRLARLGPGVFLLAQLPLLGWLLMRKRRG